MRQRRKLALSSREPPLPQADGIVAMFEVGPGNTRSLRPLFLEAQHGPRRRETMRDSHANALRQGKKGHFTSDAGL
jgi:hypothetical protein